MAIRGEQKHHITPEVFDPSQTMANIPLAVAGERGGASQRRGRQGVILGRHADVFGTSLTREQHCSKGKKRLD